MGGVRKEDQHGRRRAGNPGERAKAAIMCGQGIRYSQIMDELEIDYRTLWDWRQDPEFQRIRDEVIEKGIAEGAKRLRSLAPLAIEVFHDGLEADQLALAVQTAVKVSERIPEIGPRKQENVDVNVAVRVAELIKELDGPDAGAHELPPAPPPV